MLALAGSGSGANDNSSAAWGFGTTGFWIALGVFIGTSLLLVAVYYWPTRHPKREWPLNQRTWPLGRCELCFSRSRVPGLTMDLVGRDTLRVCQSCFDEAGQ